MEKMKWWENESLPDIIFGKSVTSTPWFREGQRKQLQWYASLLNQLNQESAMKSKKSVKKSVRLSVAQRVAKAYNEGYAEGQKFGEYIAAPMPEFAEPSTEEKTQITSTRWLNSGERIEPGLYVLKLHSGGHVTATWVETNYGEGDERNIAEFISEGGGTVMQHCIAAVYGPVKGNTL